MHMEYKEVVLILVFQFRAADAVEDVDNKAACTMFTPLRQYFGTQLQKLMRITGSGQKALFF